MDRREGFSVDRNKVVNYALIEKLVFYRRDKRTNQHIYKNNLLGIYSNKDVAEFIKSKAKKFLVAKDAIKSIEYDIIETGKPVTTIKVDSYVNRKKEINNG